MVGPCWLHLLAFLTFLVQPGWEQVLRLAPWAMHRPPWTTRLRQDEMLHLRQERAFAVAAAASAAVSAGGQIVVGGWSPDSGATGSG